MLSPYTVTVYTKQDNPYNVIPDAPIEIRERLSNGTSGSLSIIYSDQEGLIPITQTGAKADSNGQFVFYAEAAQYNAVYESQTVPVDIGLTADTLPSAIINNISLPYVFDTVEHMKLIELTVGKTVSVVDRTGSENGGGSRWLSVSWDSVPLQDQGDNKNFIQSTANPDIGFIKKEKQLQNIYSSGYQDDASLSVYKTRLYNPIAGDSITGQEYLFVIAKIAELNVSSYVELTTVFSGDSTTFGVGASGITPSVVFEESARDHGFGYTKAYNEGHSGSQTPLWGGVGGYVETDITTYPDMRVYVARWGINDGSRQTADGTDQALADYEVALREGLTKLRAFKDVLNLAIVLMTPNCISEDGNRNERWNELVGEVVRKAARDFQCVFVDTYAIFRDARREAIGGWLDDAGAGQGIHPNKDFNRIIGGVLADTIFTPISVLASNKFHNIPSNAGVAVVGDAPFQYPLGISYKRTDGAWPINGMVITENHVDRITKQTLIGFDTAINRREIVRFSSTLTTWDSWLQPTTVVYETNWQPVTGSINTQYQKNAEGMVHIEGRLESVDAGVTSMFTLPVGYRPGSNFRFVVINDIGDMGVIQIGADGVVLFVSGDNTNVYLNITFFAKN